MKYVNGVVLGLIIGLPVEFNPITIPFELESLPHSTVYVIVAFSFAGGILSGCALLHRNANPSKILSKIDSFIDYYSLLTVCMLSMGIPIIFRLGFTDIYASRILAGYFFSCVGIGLALAGAGKYLWTYRAQSRTDNEET